MGTIVGMSKITVWFRILLVAGFSEKYHVFPLSILGHCFNVVSLGMMMSSMHLQAAVDDTKENQLILFSLMSLS